MNHLWRKALCLSLCIPLMSEADGVVKREQEKLVDDPTRIQTEIGVGYTNSFDASDESLSFSGSLAFGPVKKLNARANADGSEWRLGGSWLFDVGIVNFNIGENEFQDGSTQTNYSIGTYIPLSYFGIEPWGTQLFASLGYTYNDGEMKCDVEALSSPCVGAKPELDDHYIMVTNENHSGYLGLFGLKPVSDKWTMMGMLGGASGSNDFNGYWVGLGAGYAFSDFHSVNLFSYLVDNSYGEESRMGLSYKYRF